MAGELTAFYSILSQAILSRKVDRIRQQIIFVSNLFCRRCR